jgi:hypothetical protein
VRDVFGVDFTGLEVRTGADTLVFEFTSWSDFVTATSDDGLLFLIGVEVDDFVGDFASLDDAVRCLDKAVVIDAGVAPGRYWRLLGFRRRKCGRSEWRGRRGLQSQRAHVIGHQGPLS